MEELRQKLSRLGKYIRIIENLSPDCERNFNDDLYQGAFAKIAGFRNFLAHDYEAIDRDVICHRILERLIDVKKFMSKIKGVL